MPYLTQELHLRRVERVVSGESQLGGKDTAFERRTFGTLDHRLPEEEIVFIDRPGCNAIRWRDEKGFVFGEEAFRGHAGCHGVEVVQEVTKE